ncbi:hypothetical protein I5677_08020 [Mobilitalea sibirica]|uniref:DUF3899 domain-containing protein n=1 Tax=Mobilitalea sibirica TaxID=1462919 RepID=A0A8J7H292_9FIRM|nr:hypothetical protein [Mobilitalea sibirica]MBH1940832.1 hypothetical protein [Mobilitalea sibirica]
MKPWKGKIKIIIRKLLWLFIFGLVYLSTGYIVALFISHQFGYTLQDVMSYVGIFLFFLGILLSMKGNPSGSNINGMGMSNEKAISYQNLEVTRLEREINPYHKDYYKNNVVRFAFGKLTFIIGGVMIMAFSLLVL